MLVTCRLLSQETFTIEAEFSTTVGEIKDKIEKKRGKNFNAEALKLIYAGKVWDNNTATIGELKFVDSGFIVVLINKPKGASKSEETSVSASPATSRSTSSVDVDSPPPEQPARPNAPSPAAQLRQVRPEEAFGLSNEQYEALVHGIVLMGYPREEVERALRASFFNADRAVEYLISGIPQSLGGEEHEAQAEVEATEGDRSRLAFFRNSPQFQQMRALVQQDPQLLGRLLQDIGQANPGLFQAIRDNQEEFLSMMNSPVLEGAVPAVAGTNQPVSTGGSSGLAGRASGQAGSASYIRVSGEERDAINRLKSLGFPEAMVVEAYFACDKNEEHAANFLFSQMEEAERPGSFA